MPDPTNENAGATPPENPPAGEAPQAEPAGAAAGETPAADTAEALTQATPAAEAAPAQEQVAAAAAEQPTAAMSPAYAAAPAGASPAPPRDAWYRRRWALITGAVAAAVVLFFGGMAVGRTIGGQDRGEFRGDRGPGMFRDGGGFGHEGWGDRGSQGMVPPGMGQGGQGFGHGGGWDQDGDGYGQPQAPGATPSSGPEPVDVATSAHAVTRPEDAAAASACGGGRSACYDADHA